MHRKIIALITVMVMLLCCCSKRNGPKLQVQGHMNGMWVSYIEMDAMLNSDFERSFEKLLLDVKELKITDLFVHVRPFCDAYYKSELFPLREGAKTYNFDILHYMVDMCHKNGIRLHAWINPYRVRTADSNIAALPTDSIARIWLEDETTENDTNVSFSSGIYLNPASTGVQEFLIRSIRELLNNYEVDGIHFDDYFYPTKSEDFDAALYEQYRQGTNNPLEVSSWRRENVSATISSINDAIKFIDSKVIFSISPAASIDKNYNEFYADIALWCEMGMLDLVIPQLYFGFEYAQSEYKFNNILHTWLKLKRAKNVKLIVGLGAYKMLESGVNDAAEWQNPNLLLRQVRLCYNTKAVDGVSFYSYTSLFSDNEISKTSLEYLKNAYN